MKLGESNKVVTTADGILWNIAGLCYTALYFEGACSNSPYDCRFAQCTPLCL